jgi:hypothetical protein
MAANGLGDALRRWTGARRPLLGVGLGALLRLTDVTLGDARKKHKRKKKKKAKRCEAQPVAQTCAGRCGTVIDNCGTGVACGCPSGQCCNGQGVCGACLAFLGSADHNGNFGGLSGADALCQGLATAAGLPGSYMAWLSDTTGSPSTRFVRATVPYTLVNGTVVANSWADLTDGNIAHAIDRTESGAEQSRQAWTNTKADGTPGSTRSGTPSGGQHCSNWTSDFFEDKGYLGIPATAVLDQRWTDFEERPCNNTDYRLYCFQQR